MTDFQGTSAASRSLDEGVVRLLVAAACAVVSLAGAVIVLGGVSSPARPAIVLVGLVLGTGWSVVGWIRLPREVAYVASLTLAVGVAVPIILSILLVESGWWHPVGSSGALLATAAGVNAALIARYLLRRQRTAEESEPRT